LESRVTIMVGLSHFGLQASMQQARQLDWIDTVGAECAVLSGWDSGRVRESAVWNAGALGGRPGWTQCPATDVVPWPPGRNAGVVARWKVDRVRPAERPGACDVHIAAEGATPQDGFTGYSAFGFPGLRAGATTARPQPTSSEIFGLQRSSSPTRHARCSRTGARSSCALDLDAQKNSDGQRARLTGASQRRAREIPPAFSANGDSGRSLISNALERTRAHQLNRILRGNFLSAAISFLTEILRVD
jgi:hypothetical protein